MTNQPKLKPPRRKRRPKGEVMWVIIDSNDEPMWETYSRSEEDAWREAIGTSPFTKKGFKELGYYAAQVRMVPVTPLPKRGRGRK